MAVMWLAESELQKIMEFVEEQKLKKPNANATYGIETSNASGIGQSVTVTCVLTKESKNVTDYSLW